MTIDSTWIAAFKEEAPDAFTKHIPFRPRAAFCDGQIRLMRGHTQNLLTWDDYIWQQFHSHVSKFYRNHNVGVVILAFDDYAHVPEAKCMTQLKRRRHIPKLDILEREPLPPVCPVGPHWDQCISNRVFKAKVIARVVETLPSLLKLQPNQALIIDYAGVPTEYTARPDGALVTRPLPELCPLGEADVKFTRYAEIYRDLLVDSVDGDSIPIALMHTEVAMRDLTAGTMRMQDAHGAPPRICIYRITTRVAGEEDSEPASKRAKTSSSKGVKAGQPDKTSSAQTTQPTKPTQATQPTKPTQTTQPRISKRTYEYVNIPLLHTCLRTVFSQCLARARCPSHDGHLMGMLVALIGLTGTDFSRQLPQVSGKSVFGFLPAIWPDLLLSYDPGTGQLSIPHTTNRLVSAIYTTKYSTHVKSNPHSLQTVLVTLKGSKLSQRTSGSLPTVEQIEYTARNVNWMLRYWRDPTRTPSPTEVADGTAVYGFVKRKGLVAYADCV